MHKGAILLDSHYSYVGLTLDNNYELFKFDPRKDFLHNGIIIFDDYIIRAVDVDKKVFIYSSIPSWVETHGVELVTRDELFLVLEDGYHLVIN